MKNLFKLLVIAIAFAGFTSCEDKENLLITQPEGSFSIITPSSGESALLSEATAANTAVNITWSRMDYTSQAVVNYEVQMAKDGSNFAQPITLATTTKTFANITVADLNIKATNAGLLANVAGAINFRIKATSGTAGSQPIFSNVVTYLITPYPTYLFKDYFLVGAATMPGWNNNNSTSPNPVLWRSPANENLYEFTGYFVGGGGGPAEFKLLEKLGMWQPQWGPTTAGSTTVAGNPGTQSSDPSNFVVAGLSGYYKFTLNMTTKISSLTAYAGSTSTTYTTMGIIGTGAGGWTDADEKPMVKSTFDSHLWYRIGLNLATGQIKFRPNTSWAGKSWGAATEYTGQGTGTGDANVPVKAGKYNIWFNDLTGQYSLIPIF